MEIIDAGITPLRLKYSLGILSYNFVKFQESLLELKLLPMYTSRLVKTLHCLYRFNDEMKLIEPRLYDENNQANELFQILKENLSKEDQEHKYYWMHIGFLRRMISEKPEPVVPLIVSYGILEIFPKFYEIILGELDRHSVAEALDDVLAIIANWFVINDEELLNYFIQPDLKVLSFLDEILQNYRDDNQTIESVLFAWNNIAGSSHTRDALLGTSYLQTIQQLVFDTMFKKTVRVYQMIAWGLSVFCSFELPADIADDWVTWILNAVSILVEIPREEVQSQALVIIVNLLDTSEIGDALAQYNIDKVVLQLLLKAETSSLIYACLKAFGSMTASDSNTLLNKLIKENILDVFSTFLETNHDTELKLVLWIVGNITATKNISNTKIFANVLEMLDNQQSIAVYRELATIVSNTVNLMMIGQPFVEDEIQALQSGEMKLEDDSANFCAENINEDYQNRNNQNIYTLLTKGSLLTKLFDILRLNLGTNCTVLILSWFNDIFNGAKYFSDHKIHPDLYNQMLDEFTKIGGVEYIEKIQEGRHHDIYNAAAEIIKTHFIDHEDPIET